MTRLVGLAGSLRKASFNAGLLRAAVALALEGVELVPAGIQGIPVYDGDLETAEGIPEAVTRLNDLVAGSDGLILFSPEYNNSLPGAFKNAIDWMTRPKGDIARVFRGRPVAVVGASPGGFGTILGQNAWLPVLRTLGTRPWFEGRLMVSRAGAAFDAAGDLTDDKVREQLRDFLAGFAAFAGGAAD
jgi:chromate reductase